MVVKQGFMFWIILHVHCDIHKGIQNVYVEFHNWSIEKTIFQFSNDVITLVHYKHPYRHNNVHIACFRYYCCMKLCTV